LRHHAQGVGVGLEDHVGVGGFDEIPVVVTVLTGDGLDHDAFGELGMAHTQELVGGDEFASGVTGHVRDQAFHFGNAMLPQPVLDRLRIGFGVHGDSKTGKAKSIAVAPRTRQGGYP
jgi:hypothetical protein